MQQYLPRRQFVKKSIVLGDLLGIAGETNGIALAVPNAGIPL